MITIREYARPATLEEAWQLNQKRPNRVLGGMLWLKMEKISVGTAIDLSALGLDTIEETDTEFAIGAMATLRSLETHAALNAATNGAMREAVRHIVGVQFRNCATVGGSVYGRFGFSDVLTLLLALDCDVELYKAGRMPIAQFAALPYDRDILTHVYIKKDAGACRALPVCAGHPDGLPDFDLRCCTHGGWSLPLCHRCTPHESHACLPHGRPG